MKVKAIIETTGEVDTIADLQTWLEDMEAAQEQMRSFGKITRQKLELDGEILEDGK
jgi:hypothetical protein